MALVGLAGNRGSRIAAAMRHQEKHAWAWVIRTYAFDQFIEDQVRRGADMVINLAAGLDARPYRMELPAQLRWVEVDLPDLLAYKEDVLRNEHPRCQLERVALDLSDIGARRQLFARLAPVRGFWTVVLTKQRDDWGFASLRSAPASGN